ncbi:MAG: phosphomannomutase/phosphoglucomutase [Thiothrix sp.]|nr:phosphomannomutase/phosphoglucomutase [Thiothrix sp.]HPQ96740.1 phosphomannomutase/phosphoglucomutase [Thiolinea sp.]
MQTTIAPELFRAYDVRGRYPENLTPESVYLIGQALGGLLRELGERDVLLCRDGRISSPVLQQAVAAGLVAAGCRVLALGCAPTPVLYFAVQSGVAPNGVVVTGSHLGLPWNGLKLVVQGEALHSERIQALYRGIADQGLLQGVPGGVEVPYAGMLARYTDAVVNQIHLARPLRIGLDCASGPAGLVAETLFRRLGCEVHALFTSLEDGTFPHHPPDPTDPDNLRALQTLVRAQQLDVGLAFDGDADRVIALDNNGNILWPDQMLMLMARHLLAEHAGGVVVCDVKSSWQLGQVVREAGGVLEMCPTGHSLLKARVKQHQAVLGGEFSGHFVLNDRGMGHDDGLYFGARLLEVLAAATEPVSAVFARLPHSHATPEYRLPFPDVAGARAAMTRFLCNQRLDAVRMITIDGLRAEYAHGWGLVRLSNTTPSLTLRFEADSPAALAAIRTVFRDEIRRLGLSRQIPF